jgi:hypothetical protein
MKQFACIIILLICILPNTTLGAIVEIELPEAIDHYYFVGELPSGGYERVFSITYLGPEAVILSAALHFIGTATSGLVECWFHEFPDTNSYPFEAVITEMRKPGDSGYWLSYASPIVDGSFDVQDTCDSHGAFKTLFAEDIIDLSVMMFPIGTVDLCHALVYPEGYILEAYLVLDLEYAIPSEPTTWGEIKALYIYK